MHLIEVTDLSKHYSLDDSGSNVVRALDDVSLTIGKGEFVAIVGPSGSGKSTLLQILGLLDKPTHGTFRFLGEDVRNLRDDQLAFLRSRYIGFVFQLFNLLPRITTVENMTLPTIYQGKKIDYDRCMSLLRRLKMDTHLRHTPSQLSGGQQQRVAVARALMSQPELILADEPTGNLPQEQANDLMGELEKLNREGITVVLITHNEVIAARASRVIQIVDGKIVSDRSGGAPLTGGTPAPKLNVGELTHPKWNPLLWKQTLKIAGQSLARNKARTFLTMLGIIIGVFSVVSMLAIGEGAKKYVEHTLRQMGSNMFRVESQRPYSVRATKKKIQISKLSLEDYEALQDLQEKSTVIKSVSPLVYGQVSASYLGGSLVTAVEGVSVEYEAMRGNRPVAGRFFTAQENEDLEKVCLIGQTIYRELYPKGTNPIGTLIKLNQKAFRVVGLLPTKGSGWGGDADDVVIIPYLTAMKRLFGAKNLSNLFVQARDERSVDRAMSLVSATLRDRHRIRKDAQDDFGIKNYGELRDAIEETTDTMTTFIGIVALISLIVGGIGIMNIMLVSVTERTREIGIRKAIGARTRDILMQFLTESTCIALLGGAIGICLAYAVGMVMRYILNWEVEFKLQATVLAVSFSIFVGLFFGLYPARQASRLSPINALRYE